MPLPILFVLGLLPPSEARYDVLAKGKRAGVATYRVSDRPGGGRVTRLRIVLADGSITETLSLTDAQGAAVRSENVVRRGKAYTKETVDYDARGNASVVVDKKTPVRVPFRAVGSRRDPSETWFRLLTPSPGTWAVYLALDSGERKWDSVRVTYVGKREGGNLVRQVRAGKTTDYLLDAKGVPLRIDAGDLRMVRR
jgi:hypothetical protein